jgi:hypothetical protein
MHLSWRNYHHWPIIEELAGRSAEEFILQFRADRLEDGLSAVQIVTWPASSHPAKGEARELSGTVRFRCMARSVLAHTIGGAEQDMHDAVNVDDL